MLSAELLRFMSLSLVLIASGLNDEYLRLVPGSSFPVGHVSMPSNLGVLIKDLELRLLSSSSVNVASSPTPVSDGSVTLVVGGGSPAGHDPNQAALTSHPPAKVHSVAPSLGASTHPLPVATGLPVVLNPPSAQHSLAAALPPVSPPSHRRKRDVMGIVSEVADSASNALDIAADVIPGSNPALNFASGLASGVSDMAKPLDTSLGEALLEA